MLGLMMDVPLLIADILEHAALAHVDTEIVSRDVHGAIQRMSYATALTRCRRLSAALTALGLRHGDRVGSLAWNTAEHFELFYGVSGQGLVLHTINPRLHEDTLVGIITHAEDQWIFVDAATLPLARALAPRLPQLRGFIVMDRAIDPAACGLPHALSYEALLAAQPDSHVWPRFDEKTASVICYTSGTTGDPKGVVYTHRSIVLASLFMNAADMIGAFRSGEREAVMPIAPLFHANGWMMPFTAPMNGQKLVLPGRNFEPDKLCELFNLERVTIAAAVPTVWLAIDQYASAASSYYKREAPAASGWLSTGDVARIHRDGSIEIVDRSKDVIKSGGEWISSVAIESVALDHPAVLQAAVIAISHARWQERPLLVVVPRPGASPAPADILAHVSTRVPKWWLPDDIVFVEALPMTATGKVRKAVLRETFRDHVPPAAHAN
ncbi:MAG: AMP-binding protein [Xanthobacteraceae bacterium]